MADPLYHELHAIVSPYADEIRSWNGGWGGYSNRYLMTDPRHIQHKTEQVSRDLRRHVGVIDTSCGPLTVVDEFPSWAATQPGTPRPWSRRPLS